jgi:hypothetical protein
MEMASSLVGIEATAPVRVIKKSEFHAASFNGLFQLGGSHY